MVTAKDVPAWSDPSREGLYRWWQEMAERRLIFHPDDAPDSIVDIDTGEPAFAASACQKLERIISRMFEVHGDSVYEAGADTMRELLLQLRYGTTG